MCCGGIHTVCLWVDDLPRLGIQLLLVAVDDTMLFWQTNSKTDHGITFRDIHLSGEGAKPQQCHLREDCGRQADAELMAWSLKKALC